MNSVKDQAIDSGMELEADALRGEDMEESMYQEMQHVKRKAADGIEIVRKMKKQHTPKPKAQTPSKNQNQLKTHGKRTKKPKILFD